MSDSTLGTSGEKVDYKQLFETEQSRRRGLQSENDKLKHKDSLSQAELTKFKELSVPKLDKTTTDRLNDLKYSDPDAWRKEMDSLESVNDKQISEHLEVVSKQNRDLTRKEQLNEAHTSLAGKHSDFAKVINSNTLLSDIPPRITNKYESGDMTAEDYLEQAYKFITAQKGISNPADLSGKPNLNNATGGSTPDPSAVDRDLNKSYSETIF